MRSFRTQIFAALLLITLCVAANYASASRSVSALSRQVVRLHVIANSDSEEDQACKLAVRDAVLSGGSRVFQTAETKEQALVSIGENTAFLQETAEEVIRKQGLEYGVSVEICRMDFPKKIYGDLVMPAGEYDAVRVVLGEGKGKNWWCVMYPPLCIPAATSADPEQFFTKEQEDLLYHSEKYTVRFLLFDICSDIGRFIGQLFS